MAAVSGARGAMKIYQVYNESRAPFGGDVVVLNTTNRLLAQHGHETTLLFKSSKSLGTSLLGRVRAFVGGCYNLASYNEIRRALERDRPDVVHVHSLYPMFSPSILVACRKANVPVVMTVHDHSLTCPTRFHLYRGRVCEECIGGREYRCVLKNCRNNVSESVAYALRSVIARRFQLFRDNVAVFIVMTRFGKDKLLEAAFPEDQIAVVPNPVSVAEIRDRSSQGRYVAFAGRLSAEKGAEVLLAAAARAPDIPFRLAGDGPLLATMKARAPVNVEFLGQLSSAQLADFYRGARVLVVPSLSFETFGMVAAEAMACSVPVIASRIGSLPYIVEEGITGALYAPGNSEELFREIRKLWDDPERAFQMGRAARERVVREYSEDKYYRSLMDIYRAAIECCTARVQTAA